MNGIPWTPEAGPAPRRLRPEWLYLTLGLTQPNNPLEVGAARLKGVDLSGYGWEFGFLVAQPAVWASELLFFPIKKMLQEGHLFGPGHCLDLGFRRYELAFLAAFTGPPEKAGLSPGRQLRSLSRWHHLPPTTSFRTTT